jgi:integrase
MLLNILKKNKPNITESSLKTYNSTLTNFYYENHPKNSNIDINWFDNQDEIINILKNKNNRKRILAALMAITDNNDKYKKLMYDDLKIYNEEQDKQLKTDKQKENWIEYDKIIEIYNQLKLNYGHLLKENYLLSQNDDYQLLQNYIIASLYILNEPRRLLDYVELKIKNIDKTKDNYILNDNFHFNNYKTKKTYNEQIIPINKKLKTILNKFIKINPYDYLLVDVNGKKLSSTKLNNRLNNIFGNGISVNMLRHSLLSKLYDNIPSLNEIKNRSTKMGHSINMALQYIKK